MHGVAIFDPSYYFRTGGWEVSMVDEPSMPIPRENARSCPNLGIQMFQVGGAPAYRMITSKLL